MSQVQFQAPPITKVNKIILIIAGSLFLISSIMKAVGAFAPVAYIGLSAHGLFMGLVYQLVTYPLIETQLLSFLFNSLVVWFIGSELESQWGPKVYLRFLLVTVALVGIIYSLVSLIFFFGTPFYSTPIHGLSGVNFALLIAYASLFPDRQMSMMMIFPMRARTFCYILAGMEAYMAIFSSLATAWAHLLAMGISFLIIYFQTNPIIKKVLNSAGPTFGWQSKSKRSGKKHLYVVKDEESKPPKYWQ
ncbi:MAG TPA: rhomboid family intramembrane serine protease [Bacteriovoracaceae bacterium]|nr:rhomboid family intramembrane serine protease [Bacteriovoracaceae bacterium]